MRGKACSLGRGRVTGCARESDGKEVVRKRLRQFVNGGGWGAFKEKVSQLKGVNLCN